MQPVASPRRATALVTASTAMRAFIRSLIEYPTIRPEQASLTAHTYSLPSPVGCSVISENHNWSGVSAVKTRLTRSSWTAGPRLLPPALLLAERAPPPVVAADPPRGALSHRRSGAAGLAGEEAVPELRVILVRVEQGIGPVGLGELSAGDGVTKPPVARSASELEYPARHRDGHTAVGELAHERVEPFPADSPARGTPPRGATLRSPVRAGGSASSPRAAPAPRHDSHPASRHPRTAARRNHFVQRHRVNTEISGDLLKRHTRLTATGDTNDILTELTGIGLWHRAHPSRPPHSAHTTEMTPHRAADPVRGLMV